MSNVFKITHYKNQVEKKVLEPKVVIPTQLATLEDQEAVSEVDIQDNYNEQLQIANQKANQLMESARQEIAVLKENAKKELEAWKLAEQSKIDEERKQIFDRAKEEGYREGYQSGNRNGIDEGIKQYHERIEHATSLIEQIEADWKRRIVQSEPYILELSLDIAQKIIQRELLTDKNAIIGMVKETLKQSSELKEITLAVHPDDYNFIRSRIDDLKSLISSQANLIVIPDHSITVGGCIVRTSLGTLDARVDTQLEEIKRVLMDVIEGSDIDELEPIGKV